MSDIVKCPSCGVVYPAQRNGSCEKFAWVADGDGTSVPPAPFVYVSEKGEDHCSNDVPTCCDHHAQHYVWLEERYQALIDKVNQLHACIAELEAALRRHRERIETNWGTATAEDLELWKVLEGGEGV